MIIVCDTNILISSLIFPGGKPDRIFRSIISGRFGHATSPDLLTEIRRVLTIKFKVEKQSLESYMELLLSVSELVYPTERINIIKNDPSDNRVLECAVTAKADYIISGDKKHLLPLKEYKKIKILAPSQFAEVHQMI